MGPIHDTFTPCWQTHLLRIGEPHKMLTDLRHSKRSRELSALLMKCLVSGENHNRECCVFTLCVGALGQSMRYSNDCFITPPGHTFCWGNHNLQACHTTALCSLQTISSFTNPVLYHIWHCSITLKHCKFSFTVAIKTGICSINL